MQFTVSIWEFIWKFYADKNKKSKQDPSLATNSSKLVVVHAKIFLKTTPFHSLPQYSPKNYKRGTIVFVVVDVYSHEFSTLGSLTDQTKWRPHITGTFV